MSSDDNSELWVSSDSSPRNVKMIAYVGDVRSIDNSLLKSVCSFRPRCIAQIVGLHNQACIHEKHFDIVTCDI